MIRHVEYRAADGRLYLVPAWIPAQLERIRWHPVGDAQQWAIGEQQPDPRTAGIARSVARLCEGGGLMNAYRRNVEE